MLCQKIPALKKFIHRQLVDTQKERNLENYRRILSFLVNTNLLSMENYLKRIYRVVPIFPDIENTHRVVTFLKESAGLYGKKKQPFPDELSKFVHTYRKEEQSNPEIVRQTTIGLEIKGDLRKELLPDLTEKTPEEILGSVLIK